MYDDELRLRSGRRTGTADGGARKEVPGPGVGKRTLVDGLAGQATAGAAHAVPTAAGRSGQVADRVGTGRSISDLFGTPVSAGSPSHLQRDEALAANGANGTTTGATAAPPAKSTTMSLTALYSEIPGAAKETVKRAIDGNALWFAPLTLHSDVPLVSKNSTTIGVTPGAETVIGSFQTPITDGPDPHGLGSIAAELKYTDALTESFQVEVTGVPERQKKAAEARVRTEVVRLFTETGDVRAIESEIQGNLQAEFPGVAVRISLRNNQGKKDKTIQDAGRTTIHYRAIDTPLIQLNVKAAPVGEKVVQSSNTVTTGDTVDSRHAAYEDHAKDDQRVTDMQRSSQSAKSSSKATVDIEHNKKIVDTLEDRIKRVDDMRTKFISEQADLVATDTKFEKNGVDTSWSRNDGSYDVKTQSTGSKEEGDKTKNNWAATGQKIIGIGKDIIAIPIDDLPGVGRVTRFLKGWELELADKALGLFAETGKVHYVDTKEEGKGTATWKNGTDAGSKGTVTINAHSTDDRKAKLEQAMTRQGESSWTEFKKSVRLEEEKYRSVETKNTSSNADQRYDADHGDTRTKNASGGTASTQQTKAKTVTMTVQASTKLKTTVPVVTATVISGACEVSDQPFTERPDSPAQSTAKDS
jgi:hypothetical protein